MTCYYLRSLAAAVTAEGMQTLVGAGVGSDIYRQQQQELEQQLEQQQGQQKHQQVVMQQQQQLQNQVLSGVGGGGWGGLVIRWESHTGLLCSRESY